MQEDRSHLRGLNINVMKNAILINNDCVVFDAKTGNFVVYFCKKWTWFDNKSDSNALTNAKFYLNHLWNVFSIADKTYRGGDFSIYSENVKTVSPVYMVGYRRAQYKQKMLESIIGI